MAECGQPPGTNRHSTQMQLRDDTSQYVPSEFAQLWRRFLSRQFSRDLAQATQTACQGRELGKTTFI